MTQTSCDICGATAWRVLIEEPRFSVCSGREIVRNDRPLVKGICESCAFVRTLQSPLDASIDEYYESVYSAKLQDEACDYRNYSHGAWFADVLNDFVLAHPLAPTGRLLDIGCGKGFFEERFVRQYPGWQVEGVDPSRRSIEIARAKAPSVTFHNRKFDGREYASETYDFVAMHTILNRVPPRLFVQEAARVAKAGGIVSIEIALLPQLPMELFFADHHYMFFREHVLALTEEFGLDVLKEDLKGNLSRFLFQKGQKDTREHRDALVRTAPRLAQQAIRLCADWQTLVDDLVDLRSAGKSVAFYGAGTTLAILLAQTSFPASQVFGIFEDNPHKLGDRVWGRPVEQTSRRISEADAVVLCAGPDGIPGMLASLRAYDTAAPVLAISR